ncbi:hypothetical protein CsSME_00027940 [Camellia sinensis var. sinensis]
MAEAKQLSVMVVLALFLLKFTGKEDEINLLGDGTEKPEFGEWSWMSPEQVVDLIMDYKKSVYEKVMEAFSPYLQ